jgi:hypothetical protein
MTNFIASFKNLYISIIDIDLITENLSSEESGKHLSKYAKKMKANPLLHEQRCLQRRLNMQVTRKHKQQELQLELNSKLTITPTNDS